MNLKEEFSEIISMSESCLWTESTEKCEQICLRYTIEVLEEVELNLRIQLTKMAVLVMPTKEEADASWNKTIHHKIISDKIKELKSKLKP